MADTLINTIAAYIQSNFVFDERDVGVDESFLESGLIDSTGILEIVLFLEETFGITVEDEEVIPEHFDSIARLAAYVQRKRMHTQEWVEAPAAS